ncbi:dolichol-phosphate mannosyltransferase [Klebsormidium nitens]|uniref:Dolichol-phosphate mannosyltransferase n=1 Tax=Klebsormidium nitens TaxID=105231 RepID=A0A1Y1HXX9_KLENI|nr:dolichol-phosphate mannosyltransferase [Klebsormidium nitens]|eukprot:GAQ82612.1 dolichol-phosphate mannosyltransferase [Klebsormidium nitens]
MPPSLSTNGLSGLKSVVIPVFNEVQSIGVLVDRVASVLQRRGYTYEILCIDDGSTDGTTGLLRGLASQRRDLRTIILRRNFGQTAAMSAGLDASVGDVIVTLDADLQNDPDDIPRLVEHLLYGGDIGAELADGRAGGSGTVRDDGGYDMVCGWRRERQDDVIRRVPSQLANWLIGRVTGVRLHDCGCSLKAFRADLASALRLYGETHRLIPAIAAIEGAAIAELPVRHHPRSFGSSKYPPLGRTPRVILDLILVAFLARFRDRPMQLFGFVGGALLLGAAGCAVHGLFYVWAVARHWGLAIAWPSAVPTLVLALELGVAGIQMVFLGLLADICIRIYFESQNRAHYNVREVVSSTSGVR